MFIVTVVFSVPAGKRRSIFPPPLRRPLSRPQRGAAPARRRPDRHPSRLPQTASRSHISGVLHILLPGCQMRRSNFPSPHRSPSIPVVTRRSSNSRFRPSASVVAARCARTRLSSTYCPFPFPLSLNAQAILPARSSRAHPTASVTVSAAPYPARPCLPSHGRTPDTLPPIRCWQQNE